MKQQSGCDQTEVIGFLSQPASYGGIAGGVERIDTHGAMVFLAGDRAYKLKRAVKLPYFDFSTVEKRRAVCERELAINRRTAPQIYLEVLPIRRAEGGLHFGGEGEALDWVVVMARFPEDALLDRLSAEGRLNAALMPVLARTIRRFHSGADVTRDAPWLRVLPQIIGTLEETLLGEEAAPLSLSAAPYLTALRQELQDRSALLSQRQAQGYVRRCHGDLHLKNIVLLDREPVLFDAIEFDEDLARIDVLYDLAFLLMDLWHRRAYPEANAVLGTYFEGEMQPGEIEGLTLLPFFMSLRAAIRAMISVHSLPVVSPDARIEAEKAVRDYAALAADLLTPQPAALVCIGGLSGTGKTTVARHLAPSIGAAPGAIHLRSDVERKLMFGVEPTSALPAEAYGGDIDAKVYRHLLDKASAILKAGHAVIIDAGFRSSDQREAASRTAAESGVSLRGLWLQASPEQMIARVEERRGDASDAGREVVLGQLQAPNPPLGSGWSPVDTGGSLEQALAFARQALRLPS